VKGAPDVEGAEAPRAGVPVRGLPSVCLVALQAYPILLDLPGSHGGAEVQQTLLARALAARGHPVSVVSLVHGGPDDLVHDGIRVLTSFSLTGGIPGTRFLPRMRKLWLAMAKADASIYLHQCAGALAGVVAAYCRRRGRAFIFQTASLDDVDGGYVRHANPRDRWLYRRGVMGADAVIVQTEEQRVSLLANFGRDGTVIPNGHLLPPRRAAPGTGGAIVWVGMVRAVKGPERFLELARLLPERRFVLFGGNDLEPAYVEGIRRAAAGLPNLELRGFRSREEILAALGDALCLVNTSDHEGLPNTYIEAWSVGIPVVTLGNDPDGRIRARGLGEVVGTVREMAETVERLARAPELRLAFFDRCRAYCESEHDIDRLIGRYEELFRGVLSGQAGVWR
jgi:glycosyltransferase involved in cell wall biosynthesis